MARLVNEEIAARMLGLSVHQLRSYIQIHEIFAYRDGSGWKFKFSEIDRFANEFLLELNRDVVDSFFSGELDDEIALLNSRISSSGSRLKRRNFEFKWFEEGF